MRVDPTRHTAQWTADAHNVSWYAGAMQVRVRIDDVINASSSLFRAWELGGRDMQDSFALHYDVYLDAFETQPVPSRKRIAAEVNRSVWVECPGEKCDVVNLLDISQDYEGLVSDIHTAKDYVSNEMVTLQNGKGYGSYRLTLVFKGLFPNLVGRHVIYDFSYT